jgi:hypothetical protein
MTHISKLNPRAVLSKPLLVALAALVAGVVGAFVVSESAKAANCLNCESQYGEGGGDYETPAPAPSPQPQPQPAPAPPPGMKHVEVKLLDVKANEIEDVCCFGLARDGFYLLGKLQVGENQHTITTMPRDIGNGQTLDINETLLSVNVPQEAAVHFAMDAFDKDAGKVFENLPVVVDTIGKVCAAATPFDPTGIAASCAASIPIAKPIADLLSNVNDPDDLLGKFGNDWSLASLPAGKSVHTWHFNGNQNGFVQGWSDWDYELRYQIEIS